MLEKALPHRFAMYFGLAVVVVALSGCATVDPAYRDPRDPLEGLNRAVYRFNEGFDRAILKPVARGYEAVVPAPVNRGVTNFFSNLDDVSSAINNLLQLKLNRAVSDLGRVVVNTTAGLLGVMDVASNINLPKYGEDFGQTLGAWGLPIGPYVVLPLLGPSSGRGVVGLVGDWYTYPLTYVDSDVVLFSLLGLEAIDRRAGLLGASRVLEQAALDPYSFVRDAYLQKRRSDVYDGNPPPEADFDQDGNPPPESEFDDQRGAD
jgi:phospholipid-binding lipoprotein MlaA